MIDHTKIAIRSARRNASRTKVKFVFKYEGVLYHYLSDEVHYWDGEDQQIEIADNQDSWKEAKEESSAT